MPPIINREKCTGCGTCARICNSHILLHKPKEDKVPLIKFSDECWHCNSCVLDCPAGAIRLRTPLPMSIMSVPAATLKPQRENLP